MTLKDGKFLVRGDGTQACRFRHPFGNKAGILPEHSLPKYLYNTSSSSLKANGLSNDQSQSIKVILLFWLFWVKHPESLFRLLINVSGRFVGPIIKSRSTLGPFTSWWWDRQAFPKRWLTTKTKTLRKHQKIQNKNLTVVEAWNHSKLFCSSRFNACMLISYTENYQYNFN